MSADPLLAIRGNEWRLTPAGYGERLSGGVWVPAPHLELLSTKFVETAFGVNNRRLIVSMPPRHGKSEHSSHYAPVWYLDLYPDRRFALATYGADYSREWGEKIRDTVDANPLDVRLKWRSRRTNALSTVQGGNVWSVGLRGGLTGRGLHGLGIDDPHKDWEEANSIVYRDKAWNWYTSTARSRLDPVREGPKPFVVVTMTRWHEDDLAGRLIEEQGTIDDGGLWEVVSLPAIAVDDNDPLGRKPGEALWPEMVSKEDLLETKAEVGEYVWEALYQGNPSPPAGTILLRKWWRYYESFPSGLDLDATYMSWDMSFKDSEGSDFVVGQVWGIRGANRILLDQVRDRMSFTTTCATMKTLAAKWPDAVAKYVEDTANGPAVIDALRGTIPGLVPVPAVGSKTSRAQACTPYLQAGNVWIPDPKLAPWVEDFVRECAIFPKGPQDDQVDAFTQAMIHSGVASSVVLGGYAPHKRGAGRR